MITKPFEELFDFLPKSKRQAGVGLTSGNFPFYTSSNDLTKYINEYDYSGNCLIFGTGGNPSVHYQSGRFSSSTDCLVACPKNNKEISAKYCYLYLAGNMGIIEAGFKGAGLKHISKGYISNIKIPTPPLDDQIRIAAVLTCAERLIAKRKESIKALDELLKSTFLEMFGPNNPEFHKWPIVEIRGLAAAHKGAMRTGPFGSNLLHSAFTESGDVAVLGIDNAVQNKFAWGEKRFISKKKYSELGNYRILPGDVIITIMGTIGRSAVIPDDIPLAINTKHLAAITVNHDLVNPHFLSYSIHSSPFIIDQFSRKNRGAIMNGLNLGLIKETKINKPPINLQNQFGSIILKVESIKTKQAHSLAELESLFGSLSQRAFKGELDLSRVPVVYVEAEPLETKAFSADVKVTKAFSKDELINILKAKAVR